MTQASDPPSAVEAAETLGGLPTRTLEQIEGVWRQFPQIRWLKLYGSRALGRQRPGSDIDLVFNSEEDCSAAMAAALDELSTPYLVDGTHWETLQHEASVTTSPGLGCCCGGAEGLSLWDLWSAARVSECGNTMQAISIRQLKSNPSTVLRAAKAYAMALATSHQQPAALVVALDRLGVPNTVAVHSGLALSLFRAGSISVGSDAQVAGLPPPRFLEILSSLKIPVVEGDAADLQDDLATARPWLNANP